MAGESSSFGLRNVRGGVTPRTGLFYRNWALNNVWAMTSPRT